MPDQTLELDPPQAEASQVGTVPAPLRRPAPAPPIGDGASRLSRVQVRRATIARLGLAIAVAAVAVWVGVTYVAPGIDSLYSLAWGGVLADGVRPDFGKPLTPLAHPLPIALSALLGALGPQAAYDAFGLLAVLSFLLLIYAVYRLARALTATRGRAAALSAVGVLAAVLVLFTPAFTRYALDGIVDIPFAALVLLALATVIESPSSRPWLPLVLLAAAGLLRPEAWILALLYLGWLASSGARGRRLALCGALALAGPVLWILFNLAMAGDPLLPVNSDKGTITVETIGFQRAPAAAGDDLPAWLPLGREADIAIDSIRNMLGAPLVLAGLLALAWAGWARRREPRGPAGPILLAGGAALLLTVQTVILTSLGQPLAERYLITPAIALAVVAATGIALTRTRTVAAGLAAMLVTAVIVADPGRIVAPAKKLEAGQARGAEQERVLSLVEESPVHDAVEGGCGNVFVGGKDRQRVLAARALVALGLDLDLAYVRADRTPRGKGTASNFRRDLPVGPPPYLQSSDGSWVFRSQCLTRPPGIRVGRR